VAVAAVKVVAAERAMKMPIEATETPPGITTEPWMLEMILTNSLLGRMKATDGKTMVNPERDDLTVMHLLLVTLFRFIGHKRRPR
jgi:hypothetical protein